MTQLDIDRIIAQGEGVSVELKEAKEKVPASLYETIVSFANTNGGYIILGMDDERNVTGIHSENKAKFLKNIATALNSKDNINPVMYLNPAAIDFKGKTIIVIQMPVFIDEPLFRTIIPLMHYTMSNFTGEWLKWLELDEKCLPKLAESLKNIEIDEHLHRMSWEERIAFLVSCWIGKDTEFVPGLSKLGTRSTKSNMPDNQKYNNGYVPSPDESRTKSESNPVEKITGLPDKKLQYIGGILLSLLMGRLADRDRTVIVSQYTGEPSGQISLAMIVPLFSYCVIAWYAFAGSQLKNRQTINC